MAVYASYLQLDNEVGSLSNWISVTELVGCVHACTHWQKNKVDQAVNFLLVSRRWSVHIWASIPYTLTQTSRGLPHFVPYNSVIHIL